MHSTILGKNKVVITEAIIRSDLQLDDAEGIECLPNATIFEQLTLIGYENLTQKLTFYKAFFSPQWKFLIHTILQCLSAKTTTWNEFSSTMASAIICVATNQKFNLSKYIFDSMMKHLERGVKFLMFLRFVQVFLDKQVGDMSHHNKTFVAPCHTKKIFANMKREGKGFSGRVTSLFQAIIVLAPKEVGEGLVVPTNSHYTSTTTQPSTSRSQKKQSRRKQRKDTQIPESSGPIKHVADAIEEHVPTYSNDLLLSGEDSLKLNELMEIYTQLLSRVLALVSTKTNQALEIDSLKRRVKKLEKKQRSRTHKLKRLYRVGLSARIESSEDEGLGSQEDASKQGRKIADINQDAKITLVDETQRRNDEDMLFNVNADVQVTTVSTAAIITPKEVTLAQELVQIQTSKPKAKGVVIQEPSEITTTTPSIPSKDKGKGIMLEEEERAARRREEEANIALIESWDNTHAMMEADYELAARLQAEEQGELTIKEKSKLFVELIEKRKKHFLKSKSYDEIQKLFDIEMKRVNSFVPIDSEVVEGNDAKVDDDQEEEEMKNQMEIVLDEEELVFDSVPLATKPPIIINYKIIKEGKMGYFQLIRADGSSKRYSSMIQMLQDIDREDLVTLWKLVKAKHGNTRPEEGYERVLWGDLKVMFKPDVESEVWRNLRGYKVKVWKLFSSCGVHFMRFQNMHIFMLVEKKYRLTPATITEILNKKLQTDYWNEMCYQLLKLMVKQVKK
ncbi:hypothetical protein Tco_0149813 [Tanacetum coccineum]